ncbi:MAPEG family protein [Tardiphaga sp.]|uniref:MAPEG family protein n=1 Tax=Tardiphaga sp. TaxID=1926292 RepID=UPI002631C8A0|nr:MAPEG family protein [Tardiphaga sp.]MDB5620628.1 putative transrane protein [Tardiphaga sp.]
MPVAYWCILVAALLPLVLAGYSKSGSRDNNTPRDSAEKLSGPKRRAYAAHQNAYENFAFFAVAVIAALNFGATTSTVNLLALLYIAFRIAHALLYIADKASLRSAAYGLALIANIAIFVLPAFK